MRVPVLLSGLRLDLIAAQRASVGASWRWRDIVSRHARLYLVHSGSAVVRHDGGEHRLEPGRLHWVPARVRCDYRCAERMDHSYVHCIARLDGGLDLDQVLDLSAGAVAGPAEIACVDRLITAYAVGDDAGALIADGCLRLLLAALVAAARPRDRDPFAGVLATIEERLAEPIRIAELAAPMGWSADWFTQRFKARFAMSPRAFLLRRRLDRAAALLRGGEQRIEIIARSVGIADRSSFTRLFTRHHGQSPQRYRRGG